MINRDKTITVGMFLQMLKDGRLTENTPIGIYCPKTSSVIGIDASEIFTMKNGEIVVAIFRNNKNFVCAVKDVETAGELFP